jgi:hypothetical protein
MHVFSAAPHRTLINSSGTLPSAEVYASYLEQSPDFRYRIELSVSYRVRPSEIPRLAAEEDLDPEGLEGWYGEYDARMRDRATSLVRRLYGAAQEERPGSVQLANLGEELRSRLSEEYPELEVLSAVPTAVSVPDFSLYEAARSLYFETVEARRDAISEEAFTAEQARISQESRLETLRRYGEVLSEYPVLLDYFTLSAEQDIDPLALDALRSLAPAENQAP